MAGHQGVEDLAARLAARPGPAVDQVGDHGDHGVDPGGAHVEGVAPDARVELEEDRLAGARVDLDVEVGEPPVAGRRQQPLRPVPQLGEGLGDHGHRVADEGGGVVLQQHPGGADHGHLAVGGHVGGHRAHGLVLARDALLDEEGGGVAGAPQVRPQRGEVGGGVQEVDLALAGEVGGVPVRPDGGLAHQGEGDGDVGVAVGQRGAVHDRLAGGAQALGGAGGGEGHLVAQGVHGPHVGEGHGVARLQLGAVDGQEAGRGVAVGHDDGAARAPAGGEPAQEGEHHVLVVLLVVVHVDVARQLDGLDGAGRQEGDPLPGGVVELAGQGVGPDVPADDDGQEIGPGRTAVPGADHGVLLRGGSDSLAAGAPRRRRPRTSVRGLSRWAILGSNQ